MGYFNNIFFSQILLFFSFCYQNETSTTQITSLDCYDFTYSHLTLEFLLLEKKITGSNKLFFQKKCLSDSLFIDLSSNFAVDSVCYHGDKINFNRKLNQISISDNYFKQDSFSIEVFYTGIPNSAINPPWEGGFVWDKDDNNLDWVGVACQREGGGVWWPTINHLADEVDSIRMSFSIEKPYDIISNGQLVGIQEYEDKRIFNWFVQNPINNYNVTINIGDYLNFKDTIIGLNGLLDLDYYVLPYNALLAKDHFKQVGPMLHCFEELFGAYPFYQDGYKLVETPYLGMEHQSCISYGNKFMKGYLGSFPKSIDFDFIIIHETAHEWWGNSLSMQHIKDMWIHESFATYSEALYVEKMYGYDEMLLYLNYQKNKIKNNHPLVDSIHHDTDMYYKGSWMLHTLRSVLRNDTIWNNTLKGLQLDFKHQTINTYEIIQYIENQCGYDLSAFFKQYLFHHELPVFEYFFKHVNDAIFLYFRWHSIDNNFNMPILAKVNKQKSEYSWIYPKHEWQKINLIGFDEKDFEINEDLFLVNMMHVKHK